MGGGIGGIGRLNAHAVCRKAVALIQTQVCLKNTLRVGITGHQSCRNRREALIGDVCQGIGGAGGEHLYTAGNRAFVLNQAVNCERVRSHAGDGSGAAVGHCHICLNILHCAAAGEELCLGAVAAAGAIEQALDGEAVGGEAVDSDVAALDSGFLGAAEHCHCNACRDGAATDVHAGNSSLSCSFAHCQHQNRIRCELCGRIAEDACNVGAAVVGNGNIHGAGVSAHVVAERHSLDLRAVAAAFLAGGNADTADIHRYACGVQDGAVLRAQPCVAYTGTHCGSTRVRAAENRLRLRIHLSIHINGSRHNILAEDACQSVGVVKAQEHVHANARNAAIGAEDQGRAAAGYIILYLNNRVFRFNIAGLAACLVRARSHADVGVDLGAHDGDRSRDAAYARNAARGAHEPCVGLGIGGAGYGK